MELVTQAEHTTYRLVVSRTQGRELLLVSDGRKYALPSVRVPHGERVSEFLTCWAKHQWGIDLICLFSPLFDESDELRYQVLEWPGQVDPHHGPEWVEFPHCSKQLFAIRKDHEVACYSLRRWRTFTCNDAPGPFAVPGWFDELRPWVEDAIGRRGYYLNDEFRQVNASATFSLIRFETSGPAVWFKAVGWPNLQEFPLTMALARLAPNYLPEIIAVRPDWNGWLAIGAPGSSLEDNPGIDKWRCAATTLAKLQIATIPSKAELLKGGARNLSLSTLLSAVCPFLETITSVMGRQSKVSPPALKDDEISGLGERLKRAILMAEALGIPDTIGHLDLNPSNVLVSSEKCTFLDWAEAFVGNPFLSFEYLAEQYRRSNGGMATCEPELKHAYKTAWREVLPARVLSAALELAPLLAVFAYAVALIEELTRVGTLTGRTEALLRSLARRMQHEIDELRQKEAACLG